LLLPLGPSSALSQSYGPGGGQPGADVQAQGNPFSGGLAFAPSSVVVGVGQTVRWTNTDSAVPHTATEEHGLWDLTGNYGLGQESTTGFGPGESRERAFEAGTHRYYCKVHPQQMRGVVAVPVAVVRSALTGRRRHRYRSVRITWSASPPAQGLAFDVQRRRVGGDWVGWQAATTAAAGRMRARRGFVWEFRARLRSAADANQATDWSPPVTVRG
jgi:plastocyanin